MRVPGVRGTRGRPLAACMMSCLSESANAGEINAIDGAYPAATTGDLLKTTAVGEGSEPFFVLGTTPTDLHTLIEGVRAPPTGSGCAHWAGLDSLAGMLVPLPGAAWLLVGGRGEARPGTDDFSIGNVQRRYPVLTFRRSGLSSCGRDCVHAAQGPSRGGAALCRTSAWSPCEMVESRRRPRRCRRPRHHGGP